MSEYELILTNANYAPWKADKQFIPIYNSIKGNTLVDIYRCYELWQLIQETAFLEGAFLEVGVWRGGTGALIAKKVQILGINDDVYLCDTFQGVVKTTGYDSNYFGGEHSDTNMETVEKLLNQLQIKNTSILKGIFPDETSKMIRQLNFRFCHIDVDVYQSAKDIFDWIWPKLVVGGMVVFDDYGFNTCSGITLYVNELKGKSGAIVIHNLNGHAVVIKFADS